MKRHRNSSPQITRRLHFVTWPESPRRLPRQISTLIRRLSYLLPTTANILRTRTPPPPNFGSQATYAAAATALADVGEWEWCLVLLEELEQRGAAQDDDDNEDTTNITSAEAEVRLPLPETAPAAASATTVTTSVEGEAEEEAETVLHVELDETGTPVATTSPDDGDERAASPEILAAYTATVRASGEGRAGVKAVVGVLDRMGWAGVAPGEGTYAAAISAFQACGGVWEGVQEGEGEGEATGGVLVEGAARALIDYEKYRDGTGWASPFLYRCVLCFGFLFLYCA